jgi:hypothetical protein
MIAAKAFVDDVERMAAPASRQLKRRERNRKPAPRA